MTSKFWLFLLITVSGFYQGARAQEPTSEREALAVPEVTASPTPSTDPDATINNEEMTAPPAPRRPKKQRTKWVAHLLRRKKNIAQIHNLEFLKTQFPVTLSVVEGTLRPVVEIHGRYERPGWELLDPAGRALTNPQQKEFSFFAFLNGRINNFQISARGPSGALESEDIYLFAPDAQEFRMDSPWSSLVLSLGFAGFSYYQTGFGDYKSATGAVSARFSPQLPDSRWGFYTSLDMTVFTLYSSPVTRSPQLIEGKLDGTMTLNPDSEGRWTWSALLGGNYLTLLSNGSPFGFANLVAPEFGVRVRFAKNTLTSVVGDLRYIPLSNWPNFSQHGVDCSLIYSRTLINLHTLEASLGYSAFSYEANSSTVVKTLLGTFKIGYSL
jgi:hypothetical protein